MALGDRYENNKRDYEKKKSPTLYSKYSFSNQESELDPTKLNFTFWNGLLKIAIAPLKPGTNEYDYDNAGAIYITYYKAKLLADEISLFMNDPETYNNLGVPSGTGLISISNGKDLTGKVTPCLIIRQINAEGKASATYLYEFRREHHYTIRNYNESDSSFDKIYNNDLEIELLRRILLDYYQSINGAYAYSVIDYNKFNNSRINTKLDSIAEKLGISYTYNNSNNNRKSNKSVFDKVEGRNYSVSDIDDIENQM